jgi:hypothetical protein
MINLFAIILLLISGCSSLPGKLPHTKDVDTVTVTWVRVTNNQEMLKYCPPDTLGCAKPNGLFACTIYAYEPTKIGDLQMLTLGHEALHCFIGYFHE